MRHLARTLLTLAALALLAAIWSPIGNWWQYLATATLLFLTGAMILGHQAQKETEPEQSDQPFSNSPGLPGPTTITNPTTQPERIITPDDVQHYKRTYGRKADDQ